MIHRVIVCLLRRVWRIACCVLRITCVRSAFWLLTPDSCLLTPDLRDDNAPV